MARRVAASAPIRRIAAGWKVSSRRHAASPAERPAHAADRGPAIPPRRQKTVRASAAAFERRALASAATASSVAGAPNVRGRALSCRACRSPGARHARRRLMAEVACRVGHVELRSDRCRLSRRRTASPPGREGAAARSSVSPGSSAAGCARVRRRHLATARVPLRWMRLPRSRDVSASTSAARLAASRALRRHRPRASQLISSRRSWCECSRTSLRYGSAASLQ